jgi:hypothetical protein
VVAASNSLWLDEIWSLRLAEQAESAIEILTRFRVDNNHLLNTLSLYVTGPGRAPLAYRLPAIAAGTLTVIAAGWIGAQRGRVEQWTAMLLVTTSFLLVQYSSEARGYALAILLAFISYESLRRHLETGRPAWGSLFAVAAAGGLLAHPTFAFCYLAAVYWSVTTWLTRPAKWHRLALSAVLCHALPIASGCLLYFFHLRNVDLGGGPDYSLGEILIEAGSLAVGGPQGGGVALCVSVVFAAGVIIGLRLLMRERSAEWTFFVVAVILPVIQAAVARPPFLFARYFLISIAFGLLLCSFALAHLARRGRYGKICYVLILLLFVSGNLWHTGELVRRGRGQYAKALAYMAAATTSKRTTISSDHNHGIRMLVEFYGREFAPQHEFEYLDMGGDWTEGPPDWLIIHQPRVWAVPTPRASYEVEGTGYTFQRTFDCAKLSGWQWHCYRKQPSE